ncbi:putative motility protein [Clostridium sp. P21]|uniref:Putative motility protein n=1 Tax=Clostridium muellerianum TaxID=2716538 RepID=A0A7Y0HMZ3_9CLOT|nr:YjfB family protein [Clostridium muellerianum]NMM61471.1 putative motility protein [Clostridium muellerianum]
MDISALSVAMSQSQVMTQASVSVMKIAMNTCEQNSQNMTEMIEKSANPNLGKNLDIKV